MNCGDYSNISDKNEKLHLFYGDRSIPNLVVINFRVKNNGGVPIKSNEIEEPISIKIKQGEVISSKVISTIPANIPVEVSHQKNILTLSKSLINPTDSILIEALFIPNKKEPLSYSALGRIAGIKNINVFERPPLEKTANKIKDFWSTLLGNLVTVFIVMVAGGMIWREKEEK